MTIIISLVKLYKITVYKVFIMAKILGIDEAGRGSVIGPLVMAGVVIDEKDNEKLREMGVKDSKLLTPKKRSDLFQKIKDISLDHVVLQISPSEIDTLRKVTNLNKIEAKMMAEIIKAMKADKAYVDAPQVSTEKFKILLLDLAKNDTEIVAENNADVNYPVCSAASILAKVTRDGEIEKLKKKVNYDFGVGYSHDERTVGFLKKLINDGKYPDFVRKSWITASEIKKEKEQKSLKDYKKNINKR
jgi:ribonuclease HII